MSSTRGGVVGVARHRVAAGAAHSSTSTSIARCFERGKWRPLDESRNISALASRAIRYLCLDRVASLSVQRSTWEPSAATSCTSKDIDDPLTGDFRGQLAAPVHIALLSDSLGQQIRNAIEGAMSANPRHLGGIRFAHSNGKAASALRPLNLATIPRTARGVRSLLESIEWPRAPRGAATMADAPAGRRKPRRVLLASSGMWYNLKPYCNGTGASLFGLGQNETCAHHVLGHHIRPGDLSLNHDKPMAANPRQFWRLYHQRSGVPSWGWYSWGRRLQGSATLAEYETDVATFLDEAQRWAVENASATVVWLESTPQHFAPHGGVGSSLIKVDGGTPARHACHTSPGTPIGAGEAWPRELRELCGSATTPTTSAASSSSRASCRGDWRNVIARRLLRQRPGVRVVPLAAALSGRSELHTGGGGDCTHWCEGSEASLVMAGAVLNVVAEAVAMAVA
tara:strand:+ start:1020 stop:2381 length:1362 start_codon:yes stop_codon:yes gene_type:complete